MHRKFDLSLQFVSNFYCFDLNLMTKMLQIAASKESITRIQEQKRSCLSKS